MKIIHIVENLHKGAVENLLLNVFIESRKHRPDWSWTFFCILGKEGRLDEKVRNAGGKIIYSPVTVSDKLGFLKNLRKVLIRGRYDIIHSHHDYLSGFYLLATAGIKFRKRLLHIHNTDRSLPVGNRVLHKLLLKPFKTLALYFSDVVIGVSQHTLTEFIHSSKRNGKYTVLYHGINLERFDMEPDIESVRRAFGIPADGRICLFVGRMNDLKNPVFVVEVMKHLLTIRKDVYAIFIGEGSMTSTVQANAEMYGIADHIRIVGWHENVPMVMKNSDVFVFPRFEQPKEALGIVVVEAQAAGLPMFITRGIVEDAVVINELAHYNDLNNPSDWAKQIADILARQPVISLNECLSRMKQSRFELTTATKNLIHLYEC